MLSALKSFCSFNSSRYRLEQLNKEFSLGVQSCDRVLDAGAGEAPYRDLFKHAKYETADFQKIDKSYAEQTYVCDLNKIPVDNSYFDKIIFNQVLEHVPDPQAVMRELHRVLKPGGKLLYTGPFFYEEHEQPYDFYRYTQFGLVHLFEGSNFKIVELDWLEGYFGTVAYQFMTMAKYLPWRKKQLELTAAKSLFFVLPISLLLKPFLFFLAILFHRLEVFTKFKSAGYPKNYFAVLTKH